LSLAFFLVLLAISCQGQTWPALLPVPEWKEDPALFLEPNRFSITKETNDGYLWLQMGYGHPLILWNGIAVGLEGIAWSRLRTESQFRFPVETLDYFFGTYITWGKEWDGLWRLRISHISSHDVDGKDSIEAGSSSRYSREFVELMREQTADYDGIYSGSYFQHNVSWTIGIRGYFHQVTRIEPWIVVPASLTWRFAHFDPTHYLTLGQPVRSIKYDFLAFISSSGGPVWPTGAAGIRVQRRAEDLGILDFELYYQYGASWAGTDAGIKRSTVNLQMDVRGF
jgi:hypothetical protein